MMNANSSIRVLKGNIIHGPFTINQVGILMGQGKLQVNDLVSVDGAQWMALAQVWNPKPAQSHQTIRSHPEPFANQIPGKGQITPEIPNQIDDFTFPHQDSNTSHSISGQIFPKNQINTYLPPKLIKPFKITQVSLAFLGMVCVFLPWYGASSQVHSPGFAAAQYSFNLLGILFVPWGPMVFLSCFASIVLFFVFPNPVALLALTIVNAMCHLACGGYILAFSSASSTSNASFGGVTASSSAEFGLQWGYWISLMVTVGSSVIVTLIFILSKGMDRANNSLSKR